MTTGTKATVYESLPNHLKLKVAFKDGVAVNNSMMSPEQIIIDLSRKQFEVASYRLTVVMFLFWTIEYMHKFMIPSVQLPYNHKPSLSTIYIILKQRTAILMKALAINLPTAAEDDCLLYISQFPSPSFTITCPPPCSTICTFT